jgi:PAS domain S-box-containing protein
VPVIFLTAHSDEKTLQRAKVTESYGYILKPFEERSLKATIEIALYKANEEKKVRINRDWLSIILRSLAEGVIVVDTKGEIRFINSYAESILHWEQSEVIGKHLNEVFKIVDVEKHQPHEIPFLKAIVDGVIVDRKNYILITKDNTEEIIDYTVAPLKNDTGVTIGTIIVFKSREMQNLNQDMIKNELEIPFKIQKSLLPPKEKMLSGITMNWLFFPSIFGSGDLINFFALDENHVGFFIMDVMGHGFSATLFAFTLHKYLTPDIEKGGILKRKDEIVKHQSFRRKDDLLPSLLSPAEVISRLNKQFFFEANNNPFFTIIYGIINTKTQQIRMARAGHPVALYQKKNSAITNVECEGYAIGLASDIELDEALFDFKKGDRLFLYSDGLVEMQNKEDKRFTRERLISLLEETKNSPLSEVLSTVEKEITAWKGNNEFTDDVVLMALENS